MKKYLVGGLAAVALGAPAVALAQTPEPIVGADAKVSKSNAGTRSKPTAVKFTFAATNSAESQTTVSRIVLDMPEGVRLNGSNLPTCNYARLADEASGGPSACPSGSRLGKGVAYAFVVNKGAPAPNCVETRGAARGCLVFENEFFVAGKRLMGIWLDQSNGDVQQALQGRIAANGRRITIDIPANLQQPAPGVFSALLQLSGSWNKSARRRGRTYSFVSTTGCPRGNQWAFRTTFEYVGNPQGPPVPRQSNEARQRCQK